MSLSQYAFLIKAPGYQPEQHRQQLDSEFFQTTIIGVSDIHQAVEVARQLVEQGIQLLELCGGFEATEAEQLVAALPAHVPVGHVRFTTEQQAKLQTLLLTEKDGA